MTTTTRDYLLEEIRSGNVVIYTKRQTIPSDGTTYYYFKNSEGESTIEIESISAVAGARMNIDIYSDVTVNTQGSDMNAMNARTSSNDSIGLTRKYGGDYTGNDDPLEDTIPGSTGTGGGNKVAGASAGGNTISVPPGEELLIEVNNTSNSSSYISPRFTVVNK